MRRLGSASMRSGGATTRPTPEASAAAGMERCRSSGAPIEKSFAGKLIVSTVSASLRLRCALASSRGCTETLKPLGSAERGATKPTSTKLPSAALVFTHTSSERRSTSVAPPPRTWASVGVPTSVPSSAALALYR